MTIVSSALLPFYGQYPAGYSGASAATSTSASAATASVSAASSEPVDVVDIRSRMTGSFTTAANDKFSVSDLFTGTAPTGGSIAGYKVALRADQAGAARLELDGADVTSQQSFTADQFSRLHFIAGSSGSTQDLVVIAQSGKRLADGSLVNEVDSPAVQITANVTGTRSINAAGALLTQPTGSDAAFVGIAQQSSIFSGFGAARPSLATVGNLAAAASDKFSVSDLFTGTAPAGGSIVSYKVALRGDPTVGGQLQLDGADVTNQQSFTADQFSRLHFVAGTSGSQDIVVVAQSGKRLADGSLVNEIDSPAVAITASVTGARSINAAGALLTQPTGSDAAFVGIAQQSTIFSGFGAARPGLATVGNLTAAAGDTFSVSDLFTGTAATGGGIAGYKVGLRADATGGGRLELDGADVTSQQGFTADQFSRLHFIAGASGSSQDLVVVAQSGKRLADGSLVNEIDSPAVAITTSVTGARSINAAGALLTQPTGSDAAFVGIAQQSTIFSGFGAARPSLATVGNLTAAAGDKFSVSDLFTGTAATGGGIAGYKVGLRADATGGGRLELDGADVTSQQSFTADQFSRLHFVAGTSGSQDIVVVAQSGKRLADGTLANEVDSPAVAITASVTGARSINAAGALLTQPTGSDAAFVGIAQQSTIFSGFGAARPGLATVGNLTAAAGDTFSVSDLFTGTAATGGGIAGYKVDLRADSTGGGRLELDGADVTSQQGFTADQFSRLHFIAGASGSSQDLVVVAQSGKRLADGTLANEVDSPAVAITASVTGTRSINAAGALLTQPAGSDAAFVGIAQQSTIFSGFGAARPRVSDVGDLSQPDEQIGLLANLLGAFQSTESPDPTGTSLLLGFARALGRSLSSTKSAESSSETALTWALSATELGGYQSTPDTKTLQRLTVAAYQSSLVST